MHNLSKRNLIYIIILFFISSCAENYFLENHRQYAEKLAKSANYQKSIIPAGKFFLTTYFKFNNPQNGQLNIYIEGDGYAWKNRYTPSSNPTPTDPTSLKMAIADSSANILYIARPCQYTDFATDKNCKVKFWTNARFSKEVVDAVNQLIDKFTAQYQIKNINLYGYSGGAAIAILTAAKRNDVIYIKSIAGNLNHQKLSEIHHTTPLDQSLNPADFIDQIKNIGQLHIAGEYDQIIPYFVIAEFVDQLNKQGGKAEFKLIKNADHEYKNWPEIWEKEINKK